MCLRFKVVVWLIETDMAVRSDTKKLQVNLAHFFQKGIVEATAGSCVQVGAIRNMSILNINIYTLKKMLIHEITVALVILSIQSYIFIQIDRSYMGEIKDSILVHGYQMVIGANRGRTGCKTKKTIRFGQNSTGDNGSCGTA